MRPFPAKIWQTWRLPLSAQDEDSENVRSWTKLNPTYRYELLTDDASETYVLESFHRKGIVETYFNLHDPILRADLLRYLILLADGGVYSDIDTKVLKPIDAWIPPWWVDVVNVVVGVEVDQPGNKWVDWYYDYMFCQWTIMSKPGHPLMEATVERVIKALWAFAESQNTTLSEIQPSYHDVLGLTGPGAFTDAVFQYLSHVTGGKVTAVDLSGQTRPMLFGDVLILPINSFASGQAHSGSGKPEQEDALVQHMFRGSWKSNKFTAPRKKVTAMAGLASERTRAMNRLRKWQDSRAKIHKIT
jgi:alpha 1,6-mannosyltransferase